MPGITRGTGITRLRRGALGLVAAALVAGATQIPSASNAVDALSPLAETELTTWGDTPPGLGDFDSRLDTGKILPTLTQVKAAKALDAVVRWNSFGTPASIFAADGSLGRATSSNTVTAARAWLDANRTVLGLSQAQTATLRLVNNQKFASSPARAVLFEQTFDGLRPVYGSKVTVGVAHGDIVYVSSSLAKSSTGDVASPVLTSRQAWLKAAANVGRVVAPVDLGTFVADDRGWDRFAVDGFAQEQQVRLRAIANADGTVRPVFEANVVDNGGGLAFAYTISVDAVTGNVLLRHNQVDNENNVYQFQGDVTATACGPKHPFELADSSTKTLAMIANSVVAANDITINLYGPGDILLVSYDLAFGEATTYSPAAPLLAGIYKLEICPLPNSTNPVFLDAPYVAVVAASDNAIGGVDTTVPYPPKWTEFLNMPTSFWSPTYTATNFSVICWVNKVGGVKIPGCSNPPGAVSNIASRAPWDVDLRTGLPTFTTLGNNAVTHEAWLNPLAPGGLEQAPYAPDRDYTREFTDAWNNSQCDPANLVPGGNDIEFAVGDLFVKHNMMHDFSYYLGFTESNYNLQTTNSGDNPNVAAQDDPEIGNVQAGALTGGQPSLLGRDNANQSTMQDGIPGITNQYLFQSLAGAFYAPCVDGDQDMGIVGHEYTHAISNRMVGGPNDNITGAHGGSMGESWSDLVAAEFLFSQSYHKGMASPWAVGVYATGNEEKAIRDYAINRNPLTFADLGFDTTGPEVHADGEIWNGTQWDVRQALVKKWNKKFPYSNNALQLKCARGTQANGPLDSTVCPGNRRWVQLMFDSFLLQQGATTMLDARDAMLASDQMRYKGANQRVMWLAFARNAMGVDAKVNDINDTDPTPGYVARGTKSATVTFKPVSGGKVVAGKVFLSKYEARVSPAADTIKATKMDNTVKLAPGRYDVLFAAPGYGMTRSSITVKAGQVVAKKIEVQRNLASKFSGAKIVASSAGSLNVASLIDDTEATSWAGVNATESVDALHPFVIIDLAGGKHTLKSARVSALLRPVVDANDADQGSGGRFSALRKFAIDVCVAKSASDCKSTNAAWKRIFVSSSNAFPAVIPRPVAPDENLRSFNIPDAVATHVRFVVLENQCTGYAGYAGEQDNDPLNDTDCKTASDLDLVARVAELQLFG
jgi:hypothetical protein